MSINLVTYANQTVTPTNDAIIYEKAIDQNGIFYGCNVTVTSNTVNITGGYGIICGREFVINSDSLTVTLAPSGTLQGRLYVRLDLADADAPIQLLTATGNTLPALTQDDDVNYTNGVYEMELATFTVGVSALSDVVETFEEVEGTKERIKVLDDEQYTDISSFRFYKRGKMVTCVAMVGEGHHLNPTSALVNVGTLPAAFRPAMDVQAPMLWGNYVNVTGMIQILANGDVQLYASSAQSDVQPWISFTYCVA